jgi:hypothetical protein
MPVTEPMADAERLAALIDGRLDERQRTELLEQLAISDADLEVLADAAAVTRELEEEDRAAAASWSAAEGQAAAGAEVLRLKPPRRRLVPGPRWLPLAAVLAGIALGGGIVMETDLGGLGLGRHGGSPTAVVDHLADAGHTPPGELDPSPWSHHRGSADARTALGQGVRLGVRLVDLKLALRRRDPGFREVASDLRQVLEPIEGSSQVAAYYGRLTRGEEGMPSAQDGRLLRYERAAADLADGGAVALGAWARAAEVAAAQKDAAFFAATRPEMERLSNRSAGMRPDVASALWAVRADLPEGGPPAWSRLVTDLNTLLAAAGQ